MVNQNLIMTITTIPDFFVVEIVEISVNYDHLMIKWYFFHGQIGHFDHDHLSWSNGRNHFTCSMTGTDSLFQSPVRKELIGTVLCQVVKHAMKERR